jgi:DNA-binding transcriptional ArsR family regulator
VPRLEPSLKRSVPVFAALGDELRLTLVTRLGAEGPLSITSLTDGTRVTRQAVTKHLHVLEGAGLVRSAKQGREQHWEVRQAPLSEARRCLELIAHQWDDALARLKRAVETEE